MYKYRTRVAFSFIFMIAPEVLHLYPIPMCTRLVNLFGMYLDYLWLTSKRMASVYHLFCPHFATKFYSRLSKAIV